MAMFKSLLLDYHMVRGVSEFVSLLLLRITANNFGSFIPVDISLLCFI